MRSRNQIMPEQALRGLAALASIPIRTGLLLRSWTTFPSSPIPPSLRSPTPRDEVVRHFSLSFRQREFHLWRRRISLSVINQDAEQLFAVPARALAGSTDSSGNGDKSKKWRFSAIFLFLPCVATFGLGTWQLFRRQWKIEVLDYRRKRLAEEPIPLVKAITIANANTPEGSDAIDKSSSPTLPSMSELEFRTVICEGKYDKEKSIYVGPRARTAFGVTQKGYFVITPLAGADDQKSVQIPVLVNRGWVPSNWVDDSAVEESTESLATQNNEGDSGQAAPWWKIWGRSRSVPLETKAPGILKAKALDQVRGVIRSGEQPNMFVPLNVPSAGQWFYVDVPAMARALGLPETAILIEVVQEPRESGRRDVFPIAKDPEALLHASVMPQDHINYALTWYTLSAATTLLAVKRVWGSPKRG